MVSDDLEYSSPIRPLPATGSVAKQGRVVIAVHGHQPVGEDHSDWLNRRLRWCVGESGQRVDVARNRDANGIAVCASACVIPS